MYKTSKLICTLGMTLALLYSVSCGSQAPTSESDKSGPVPKADAYTLDVVIFSPITIVQYKSGSIDILLPNVDKHAYGYVKGMNDCAMDEGKGQDYSLDFLNTGSPTSIDPQHTMPDEVKIDNSSETVNVDPFGLRFSKVSLPAPREILPIHLDDEGLSIYKPGGTKPQGHLYPTQIALRYKVPANPQLSLINTKASIKVCSPQATQLGDEMILAIGMGPAVDDDDHAHAKAAFQAERDSLPDLKRDIDYPKRKRTSDDIKMKRHRASDCQAPIILVMNADPAMPPKK